MKHLFSFLLLGALSAVTFYNCQKQSLTPSETATVVSAQNEEATDRGGPCNIVLSATGLTRICGTTNGTGTCTLCNGAVGQRQAEFGNDAGSTHTFGSAMTAGNGSLTNISGGVITVTVTVNGVVTQQVKIAAGGCANFTSGDCFFTII